MKPYLIITLRRTGGTTFSNLLMLHTQSRKVLHEPLNKDRVWSEVAQGFSSHGDQSRCENEITRLLDANQSIKHCIEMVPFAITKALIHVAQAKGYRIILLTRRDEVSRIRSLMLARLTGLWGGKEVITERGDRLPKKVSRKVAKRAIKELIKGLRLTSAAIFFLRLHRVDFSWLVFEEIYYDTPDQIEAVAKAIGDLGYEPDRELIGEKLNGKSELRHLASNQWAKIKYSDRLDAKLEQIYNDELSAQGL